MYEFYINDDIKTDILNQLEVFRVCDLVCSYEIEVINNSFDHEFGTKIDLDTRAIRPVLHLYFKVGKDIEAECCIGYFRLKNLLSHTVYDTLIDLINRDHQKYAVNILENYNE